MPPRPFTPAETAVVDTIRSGTARGEVTARTELPGEDPGLYLGWRDGRQATSSFAHTSAFMGESDPVQIEAFAVWFGRELQQRMSQR